MERDGNWLRIDISSRVVASPKLCLILDKCNKVTSEWYIVCFRRVSLMKVYCFTVATWSYILGLAWIMICHDHPIRNYNYIDIYTGKCNWISLYHHVFFGPMFHLKCWCHIGESQPCGISTADVTYRTFYQLGLQVGLNKFVGLNLNRKLNSNMDDTTCWSKYTDPMTSSSIGILEIILQERCLIN